jgi:hypothetical protein
MQGIRDVYFFADTLLQEFQAHPGNDGKTSEFEPVLGEKKHRPTFHPCSNYEAHRALRPAFHLAHRDDPCNA